MTTAAARLGDNRRSPINISGLMAWLQAAQTGAAVVASALPAVVSASRYQTAVAPRILGAADPDDAVRLLRRNRQTHGVLIGAAIAAAESRAPVDGSEDAAGSSLYDLYEATTSTLSEEGQSIMAATLLFLIHETEEGARLNATRRGQAEWAKVLSEEAWSATFDRFGAILCLALADRLGHRNVEVGDRLAWEAWKAGTVIWPVVENARRRLQVVDRTFAIKEPEPAILDYLDAATPEELVSWIDDDDELNHLTAPWDEDEE